jgi:CubicO group peptidase (beta-lactamase class C family)
MTILFRPALLAALALALLPAVAPAQTDQWSSVRDTIRAYLEQTKAPSVAVAVARGGRVVWEEGFGLANRETNTPATATTMYSLASISKPITATGLMILAERGKVNLDRPANEYLGAGKLTGLAGDASGATVRRVMSHTAGLPLHYQFYYVNQSYPALSNDDAIARYGIMVYPPGLVYEYSNLGYGIIDHIIARVSGSDYADFMRTNVFLPLGLTQTTVGVPPGVAGNVAERYDRGQRPIPFYDFDHRGGSAVYSSAHDLIRFGMFHLKNRLPEQRRILNDTTIDLMQRAVPPANYGLGWIVTERDGQRIVAHTGGMPGVATVLAMYPAENVAIVVLTNMSADIGRVYREIERVVLPRYAEGRRRARVADSTAAAARRGVRFTPPAELLGEWKGTLRTWEKTVPIALTFQPDGDVHVKVENGLTNLVNNIQWRDSMFVGRFAGTIPTSDAKRWAHDIVLSLRLLPNGLNGMAAAVTTTDPVYYALTSYVSLTRSQQDTSDSK